MKNKLLIIIAIIAIIVFILWSLIDTTCIPCIMPPDAPENYACTMNCKPEPRWVGWLR